MCVCDWSLESYRLCITHVYLSDLVLGPCSASHWLFAQKDPNGSRSQRKMTVFTAVLLAPCYSFLRSHVGLQWSFGALKVKPDPYKAPLLMHASIKHFLALTGSLRKGRPKSRREQNINKASRSDGKDVKTMKNTMSSPRNHLPSTSGRTSSGSRRPSVTTSLKSGYPSEHRTWSQAFSSQGFDSEMSVVAPPPNLSELRQLTRHSFESITKSKSAKFAAEQQKMQPLHR